MSKHLSKFKVQSTSKQLNQTQQVDMSYDDALDVRGLMTPNPNTRRKKLADTAKKDPADTDLLKISDALEKNSHNGAFIGMKGDFSKLAKVS